MGPLLARVSDYSEGALRTIVAFANTSGSVVHC